MQSDYAPAFDREMGCTEAEWRGWLPGAVRDHTLDLRDGQALVDLAPGALRLAWLVMPPRRIGLVTLPRLNVQFRFEGVDADARLHFMRYFDLYMHRGGG
jgi:hypothetical protein